MSNFEQGKSIRAPQRGEQNHLTREEEEFIKRYLSRPESFPPEFWRAVIQKVSLDGEPIPQSQIQGLSQFRVTSADPVAAAETSTSTSFVDLSTVGPRILGLSDGQYLVILGNRSLNSAGGATLSIMGVEVNDTAADDTNAIVTNNTAETGNMSISFLADLRNNNNNTLTAKYRVSGASTGTWGARTMLALKVAN
jgi:hypothetical protein